MMWTTTSINPQFLLVPQTGGGGVFFSLDQFVCAITSGEGLAIYLRDDTCFLSTMKMDAFLALVKGESGEVA